MATGRPTDYNDDILARAWDYVNDGWIAAGDKVPTVAGLACEIGVHRDTCYEWAKDENKQFSDILEAVSRRQERELVNNGLDGAFAPTITKMMLTKHGYSDRVENDHTSSDGTMTPKPSTIVIQAAEDDDGND